MHCRVQHKCAGLEDRKHYICDFNHEESSPSTTIVVRLVDAAIEVTEFLLF